MNIPLGGAENQYYNYELLEESQQNENVFYPKTREEYFDNSKKKRFGDIKKMKDEIRLITIDIAVASSTSKTKNDYSSIKCQRVFPTKQGHEIQECYLEEMEGVAIDDQALRVKQLYMLFDADIIVSDGKTLGITFTDAMAKITYDPVFEMEHPAIRCFNDDAHGDRCYSSSAIPCLYVYTGDAKKNHIGHTSFKNKLTQKLYKFPIASMKSIDLLKEKNEYNLGSIEDQARYESLFLLSDATLHEMMNLNKEEVQGGYTRLEESGGGTKDKYMSSMMGVYYVVVELDPKLSGDEEEDFEEEDYNYCVGKVNWYR